MSAGSGSGATNKHGGSWKHAGGKHGGKGKHHPKSKKPKGIWGQQMFPGGPHHPAVHHHPHHHRNQSLPRPNPRGAPLLISDVHCCTAQALAASMRMAGWPVGDEDILALYFLTTDDPGAGATIPAMLEAAHRFGLAGVHPTSWDRIADDAFHPGDIQGVELLNGDRHTVTMTRGGQWSWGEHYTLAELPAYAEETWTVRWPR